MALSIIVPIFNEQNINAFLEQFSKFKGVYEVILVSPTKLECQNAKVIYTKKGRAIQQNAGAKAAKYENLWFLHFDSKFEKNANLLIENALKKSQIGCFSLKFDEDKLLLKIIAKMSNFRVKIRNIAFGDQGIFMKKELFLKLGGFREIDLMEDFDLSLRVKKKGIKIIKLDDFLITSARKFTKNGILKTIFLMQKLQLKFLLGANPSKLASKYYEI